MKLGAWRVVGGAMAGNNFIAGRGGGLYEAVTDAELVRRAEIIRRAKQAVGGRELTDRELDALLEPTPCRRTRTRLAKRA